MRAKQRFNPETVGTPVADIGRQEVIRRFQKLHQLRLERLQAALSAKQQIFITLLPLLFHQNIPLLPGFIHTETPSGLANYLPDRQALLTAKTFSKSYSYKNIRPPSHAIEAIFLMGNVASIAFSKSHPIDIWVYHQTDLTVSQLKALQLKAKSIAEWAASLGLLVHFCLLDSVEFLNGHAAPANTDNSGHLPHCLLLDAFYRSSVYVAGKFPAWWVIPPHEEKNYLACLAYLKQQRFIQEQDFIDLGGIPDIQVEELLSATFRQLYSALTAPYKALLPLLVLDGYVREYPQPDWLCLHLKQAVYEGIVDIDELDPYSLIYRQIERYGHEHPERLVLFRQCFYLTIMDTLSNQPSSTVTQALRLEFVQKAAQDCEWPVNLLPDLMLNKTWNINKAAADASLIQLQLQQSYARLDTFIQSNIQSLSNDHALEVMRRQVQTFLSPKPGKVDVLSTQSDLRVQEDEFSLLEELIPNEPSAWLLFAGKVISLDSWPIQPLKRTDSYFEALVWLVVNGGYHKHIILTVVAQSTTLSSLDCHRICKHLAQLFGNRPEIAEAHLEAYANEEVGRICLTFINLGNNNLISHNDSKAIINQQTDAFRYGASQACLIQTIDSVIVSKWGEITVKRYLGQTGLLDYFIDILNALAKPLHPEQLELVCFTPMRGNIILYRMNSIFKQLCITFTQLKLPQITRYFLAVGRVYYCIQHYAGVFSYWEIPTKTQLYQTLGEPQVSFSQAVFDPQIALNSIIPTLYTFNQAHKIQCFYLSNVAEISVYVLDEKGALFTQQHLLTDVDRLLNQYALFLEAVIKQYFSDRRLSINYYEILLTPGKGLNFRNINVQPFRAVPELAIRISAEQGEANKIDYRIHCNAQVFTHLDHGSGVFSRAAEFIARYRQEHNHYPLHITAVDVPLAALGASSLMQLQTVQLLHFKQKLEGRLLG